MVYTFVNGWQTELDRINNGTASTTAGAFNLTNLCGGIVPHSRTFPRRLRFKTFIINNKLK